MPELLAATVTAKPRAPAARVSVCIANWNCRELLRQCLQSIFDQPQGASFEVIVADNGSTDGATDMIRRDFPQVRLIKNNINRGFSAASNQAAAAARGSLLFFLNNDTRLPAFALRDFAHFFERNPDVGMAGPCLRNGDGRFQISYRRQPCLRALLHRVSLLRWTGLFRRAYYDFRRGDYRPDVVQEVEALLGAAVVLPREIFFRCGGWDERYRFGVEDLDLSAQVRQHAPVVYLGSVEVTHFGREASRGNIGFAAPNVAVGFARFLRKSGVPRRKRLAYKLLVTVDTPLQLAAKLGQAGLRALRGQRIKAGQSLRAARGLAHFLFRDIVRFWNA